MEDLIVKNLYINVAGGLGYNIALTHVLPEIKEHYSKVFILSPYTDVFECSPYVDGVYKPEDVSGFIFDAKNEDGIIVMHRLYDMDRFIKKEISYSDAWRILLGLPEKKDKGGTNLKANFNTAKFPVIEQAVNEVLKQIDGKFIICQFWGGQSPLVQVPQGQDGKPDWNQVPYGYDNEPLKRHYPVEKAKAFVEAFRKDHPDIKVVLYSLPNEPAIEDTFKFQIPYLSYYDLAKSENCIGIVSIDSSLPHLTAGLKPTVVIWGHSLPQSFGYSYNKNIIQKCNRDTILYFSALGPSSNRIDYIEPEELEKEVSEYLFH